MDCCVCLETKEPADFSDRWHTDTQTHPVCASCAPRVEVLCPVCRALPLRDEAPRPILPFRENARGSPLGPLLLGARSILGPNNLHAGPEARMVVYSELPVSNRTYTWGYAWSRSLYPRTQGERIFSQLVVHLTLLTLRVLSAHSSAQTPDHAGDRRRAALAVSVSESVATRLLESLPESASEEDLERFLSEAILATRA